MKRLMIEQEEKWYKIEGEIPTIRFDTKWEVKIIPPYGGAMARFKVFKKGKVVCSVYLDWYGKLGFFGGEPYYELYPFENDVKRYGLSDVRKLEKDIDILFKGV